MVSETNQGPSMSCHSSRRFVTAFYWLLIEPRSFPFAVSCIWQWSFHIYNSGQYKRGGHPTAITVMNDPAAPHPPLIPYQSVYLAVKGHQLDIPLGVFRMPTRLLIRGIGNRRQTRRREDSAWAFMWAGRKAVGDWRTMAPLCLVNSHYSASTCPAWPTWPMSPSFSHALPRLYHTLSYLLNGTLFREVFLLNNCIFHISVRSRFLLRGASPGIGFNLRDIKWDG